MGSSPKHEVKKQKKWSAHVSFYYGGTRMSAQVKGLNAPTESEVYNALYDQYGRHAKVEIIEIYYPIPYYE